jgi:hypothetical protein
MTLYQGWQRTPDNVLDKQVEFGSLPHLRGSGNRVQIATPYKSVQRFFAPAFTDEPQDTGDCTSHATRNATDISRAVEIDIKGEPEEWVARGATEGVYGYRGHVGEGMNPGMATEFCTKYGLLLRQPYPFADLSKYDSKIGTNWGRGLPIQVIEEASKHPCRYFALIRNVDQARDALASGYGIHCGSNYGNDGKRDARGFSRRNASWNHDMAWGAYDDDGILVLNSWGIWNEGGHPQWGPIPGGSFLVINDEAERMIREGECWAVGNVQGWPRQDLPDYGTGTYL